jgi:DNA polymerase-3 subunit alpha
MLSCDSGNADKIRATIGEATRMGISIFGPNINKSGNEFTPHMEGDSGYILFGLAAIKGVGDVAAGNIIGERDRNGAYGGFIDFMNRVDSRIVNKRVLEVLILTGSFDDFGHDRKHLMEYLPTAMQEVATMQSDKSAGQMQLFDVLDAASEAHGTQIPSATPPMSKIEKLRNEKSLLGFYVSGNPLEDYSNFIPHINFPADGDLFSLSDRDQFRICGIVGAIGKKITKKDNRAWAFFSLETEVAQYKMNCFPDAYERVGNRLGDGALVMVTGNVRSRDGEVSFNVSEINPVDYAIAKLTKTVTWLLDAEANLLPEFLDEFKDYVHENDGITEHIFVFEFCDGHREKAKLASSLRSSFDIKRMRKFFKNASVKAVHLNVASFRQSTKEFRSPGKAQNASGKSYYASAGA